MDNLRDLFKIGQHDFQTTVAELRQQGVMVSPKLELCAADDLLCYYHLGQRVIYLSLPDRDTPQGKLQLLLLRSLLACDTNEEVFSMLRLVLPWLVVHEIAHHLRHQYGLLSVNVWQEEQIANQLAIAISKPRFSPRERTECHRFLQRATRNLITKLEPGSNAVDSYHNLAYSLNAAGLMPLEVLQQSEYLQKYSGLLGETILNKRLVKAPFDIEDRIRNRHRIIEQTNFGSRQNIVRHLYYYFGWMDIGLMSLETWTIQDFAQRYLNQEPDFHA